MFFKVVVEHGPDRQNHLTWHWVLKGRDDEWWGFSCVYLEDAEATVYLARTIFGTMWPITIDRTRRP